MSQQPNIAVNDQHLTFEEVGDIQAAFYHFFTRHRARLSDDLPEYKRLAKVMKLLNPSFNVEDTFTHFANEVLIQPNPHHSQCLFTREELKGILQRHFIHPEEEEEFWARLQTSVSNLLNSHPDLDQEKIAYTIPREPKDLLREEALRVRVVYIRDLSEAPVFCNKRLFYLHYCRSQGLGVIGDAAIKFHHDPDVDTFKLEGLVP